MVAIPVKQMDDLTKATDAELASALTGASDNLRDQILLEVKRRKAVVRAGQSGLSILESAKPFDPRTDISADARYLWKNAFIWFWVVPAASIALYFLIASLK
jgi:hypothetical protein